MRIGPPPLVFRIVVRLISDCSSRSLSRTPDACSSGLKRTFVTAAKRTARSMLRLTGRVRKGEVGQPHSASLRSLARRLHHPGRSGLDTGLCIRPIP